MTQLRVLIGCEESGVVRRAFAALGHDAWSCDLQPAADGSNRHIIGDVRDVMLWGWDLLAVFHPPCTRLCNSGVRWLTTPPPGKTADQMQAELAEGAALFSAVWNAPIPPVAVENPVMHKHAKALIQGYQPPAQTVQPWWFGEPFFKATGLYLRGLPPLQSLGLNQSDMALMLGYPIAARRKGCSTDTIRRRIAAGEIEARGHGKLKQVRV